MRHIPACNETKQRNIPILRILTTKGTNKPYRLRALHTLATNVTKRSAACSKRLCKMTLLNDASCAGDLQSIPALMLWESSPCVRNLHPYMVSDEARSPQNSRLVANPRAQNSHPLAEAANRKCECKCTGELINIIGQFANAK